MGISTLLPAVAQHDQPIERVTKPTVYPSIALHSLNNLTFAIIVFGRGA